MGGQDGCEQRIKVFVKIQKIYIFFFWGGGGRVRGGSGLGGGRVWGGQGRCEQRSEVFVKINKKKCVGGGVRSGGGGGQVGGGVGVDVNEELKLKKNWGGGGVRLGGSGWM